MSDGRVREQRSGSYIARGRLEGLGIELHGLFGEILLKLWYGGKKEAPRGVRLVGVRAGEINAFEDSIWALGGASAEEGARVDLQLAQLPENRDPRVVIFRRYRHSIRASPYLVSGVWCWISTPRRQNDI